jgi:hypothetical protein
VVFGPLAVLLALCGCSATAQVAVTARPNGTGAVTVTVTLDKAATASVGDVASELQTSDLPAAGWTVTGPITEAGGSTVIRATKPFVTLGQASSIVQEIAGSGPAGSRPFQLAITRHRTFWKTTTTLSGDVDLRCGLSCFGDSGLKTATGSSTGIDPATAGADPAGIFHFAMAVALPGTLHSTNAASRDGSQLQWTPTLGSEVPLMAVTETADTAHIEEVTVASAVGLFVVVSVLVWWVIHRWRRRRRRKGEAVSGEASAGTGTSPTATGKAGRRWGRRRPAHARKD